MVRCQLNWKTWEWEAKLPKNVDNGTYFQRHLYCCMRLFKSKVMSSIELVVQQLTNESFRPKSLFSKVREMVTRSSEIPVGFWNRRLGTYCTPGQKHEAAVIRACFDKYLKLKLPMHYLISKTPKHKRICIGLWKERVHKRKKKKGGKKVLTQISMMGCHIAKLGWTLKKKKKMLITFQY